MRIFITESLHIPELEEKKRGESLRTHKHRGWYGTRSCEST